MNSKTLGTLLGGVGGAGLGAMTAGLIGINPAWGLLGAVPGSVGGSKLGQWYAQNNMPQIQVPHSVPQTYHDPQWDEGARYLKNTYGIDIEQEWETIPSETLQKILKDPKYHFYIDGPNEGLYVGGAY